MIRLSDDQFYDATALIARSMAQAEREGFRTQLGIAYMVLGALGEHYDVEPLAGPATGPFANDETEAAIAAIWENADREVDQANALFDWIAGDRP